MTDDEKINMYQKDKNRLIQDYHKADAVLLKELTRTKQEGNTMYSGKKYKDAVKKFTLGI
jgi:hypothetical protein